MSEPSATEAVIFLWAFIVVFGIALALAFGGTR